MRRDDSNGGCLWALVIIVVGYVALERIREDSAIIRAEVLRSTAPVMSGR